MKRLLSIIFAAICYPCSFLFANYTIEFELGAIRTASGAPVPVGSIGILVADTGNDGFILDGSGRTIIGSSLSVGQALGASDNIIIQAFSAADLGGDLQPGETGFHVFPFQFDSSLGNFQPMVTKLALYWFPTITTTGSLLSAGVSYGFYRSDTYNSEWGTIAFFIPPESVKSDLMDYDTNNGGNIDPNSLKALYITTIPEPSSIALLSAGGALMIGAALRRRKMA